MVRLSARFLILAASALGLQPSMAAAADDTQIARGEYLVTIGGCNDCHTPGYFFGKPDTSRFLGGSDVGFEIQGQGVFVGCNITPDKETGIGSWTMEQIVTALQTGQRPDGRVLAPIMPWHAFAQLTEEDVTSIAAFLQSLKPVPNQVPGPFKPGRRSQPLCSGSCRRVKPRPPRQTRRLRLPQEGDAAAAGIVSVAAPLPKLPLGDSAEMG